MRQLRELSPEDLDAPKIVSIGVANVQGQPVLVVAESQGDTFISRHFVNTSFESTALENARELIRQISDLARMK